MAKTSGKNSSSGSSRPSKRTVGRPSGQREKPSYQQQIPFEGKAPLLDERARLDIIGVVLGVVALALLVCMVIRPEGVVSQALATGLSLVLGLGAYLLPFLLGGLAATVFVRTQTERLTARTGLGLGLLFIALLGLFSLFVPGAEGEPYLVFTAENLTSHGGYVGSGIAWILLNLFGLTISVVIMVGLVLVALIVIGFSLSGLINNIRDFGASHLGSNRDADPDAPLPRISRKAAKKPSLLSDAETQVLASADDVAPWEESASSSESSKDAKGFAAALTRKLGDKEDKKPKGVSKSTEAAGVVSPPLPAPLDEEPSATEAKTRSLTRKLPSRKKPESPEVDDQKASKTEEGLVSDVSAEDSPKKKRSKIPVSAPQRQEGFDLPSPEFLNVSRPTKQSRQMAETLAATAEHLAETLAEFGIAATVVDWVAGPTVTLFKVDLPAGVRVSRVTALTDDIALALASPGVRIFAPVPGTNYVGIEVPNHEHQTVLLGDVLKSAPAGPLQIAIGKDVEGHSIVSDLAKMPHLLIGGTTGSGKSVAINGMIMSILMRATPAEVRLIMIDPKRVEFTPYNGIPHLYVPVVTECKEAAAALAWAVAEMERRLKEFSKMGVRNIGQYNAKIYAQNQETQDEADKRDQEPYIVVVIDELADLMMNVGKEVEFSIARLAQLARAAGIHLIVATQRPSTNVVTGLIKANITNRMAFNVASGIDSRVILDQTGAENLIGQGDLLLSKPEFAKPVRIQGCFVSEDEIEAVVEHLKSQGEPDYHTDILKTNLIHMGDTNPDGTGGSSSGPDDPLVWEAAEIVCNSGLGSTSNLQRRLSVGYARAGRIMDLLEEKGIVGPANGSRPREVLLDPFDLEGLKALELSDENK